MAVPVLEACACAAAPGSKQAAHRCLQMQCQVSQFSIMNEVLLTSEAPL